MAGKNSLNWRTIEIPTYCLRSKLGINCWKNYLLGENHDPFEDQSDKVIERLEEISFQPKRSLDKRTYLKWWNEGLLPQKQHISDIAKSLSAIQVNSLAATKFFDPSDISTPITRHLRALDARNLELVKEGDVLKEKEVSALACLGAIKKVWSIYIDEFYEHQGPLDLRNQVAGLQVREGEVLRDLRLVSCNPYACTLPQEIFKSYQAANPITLINFLINIGIHFEPLSEQELEVWAFDLASLAAIGLTIQYSSMSLCPSNLFGEQISRQIGFLARLFWDNSSAAREMVALLCPESGYRRMQDIYSLFSEARDVYYFKFLELGLTEIDVMSLTHLYVLNKSFIGDMWAPTSNGKYMVSSL